jgi:hypothetical protein
MAPRPFKLLSGAEVGRFRELAQRCVGEWTEAWFAEAVQLPVRCFAAHDYPERKWAAREPNWTRLASAPDRWVAVLTAGDADARLQEYLFRGARGLAADASHPSVLAAETGKEALLELATSILAAMPGQNGAGTPGATADVPPDDVWYIGSGGLVFELELGQGRATILASPGLIISACGAARTGRRPEPRFVDFREALRGQTLEVRFVAGEAELELGTLQTMVVGDVVRLDSKVDEPLMLIGPAGSPLAAGYLGIHEGRKAAQLAKARK